MTEFTADAAEEAVQSWIAAGIDLKIARKVFLNALEVMENDADCRRVAGMVLQQISYRMEAR